jgi:hypothetical protein
MDNREIFINTLKNLDLPTKELLNKYLKAYGESIRISAKQEGRVEGIKQELKDTLTTLKAIDSELDRRNVDMMLKTLIKIKEKRLKKLKKGGKE